MIKTTFIWVITGIGALLHSAEPTQVETVERGATRYLVWRVAKADLGRLQMHWLDTTGRPLANFGGLRQHLATQGLEIEFATNAGIYERGPKPCGLTVCQGREVVALNLKEGEGNFYRKDASKRTVSFHAMASFFLEMGCEDALFLDGDISDFAVTPKPETVFTPQTYAAMFALVRQR